MNFCELEWIEMKAHSLEYWNRVLTSRFESYATFVSMVIVIKITLTTIMVRKYSALQFLRIPKYYLHKIPTTRILIRDAATYIEVSLHLALSFASFVTVSVSVLKKHLIMEPASSLHYWNPTYFVVALKYHWFYLDVQGLPDCYIFV